MKTTMKCVFLEKICCEPIILEIPIPNPKDGEVLVKIDSAPINHSDMMYMEK